MGLSKTEAIRQLESRGSVSNQQALVKKIEGVKAVNPIKRIIPGGKELSSLKPDDLTVAVYTWLRGCNIFTEALLSLCSDSNSHKSATNKVIDFDTNTKNTEWEIRGKRWLAERVVDVLRTKNILSVRIKKEGIYSIFKPDGAFGPSSNDWEPYIQLTPFKPPKF
jgi:hypothetical protein